MQIGKELALSRSFCKAASWLTLAVYPASSIDSRNSQATSAVGAGDLDVYDGLGLENSRLARFPR